MKVVSLALLYLGSISFFGVEAAKLDIASDFKRKWSSWRARREKSVALTAGQAAALDGKPVVLTAGQAAALDRKPALTLGQAAAGVRRPARSLDRWSSWRARRNEPVALTAGQAAALDEKPALTAAQAAAGVRRPARSLDSLRAKRNQLPNAAADIHLQRLRELCGFGTCTVHNLAHLIHHYMDKDKDVSAPPEKFGPQGYGRRRRRSVLDTVGTLAGLGPARRLVLRPAVERPLPGDAKESRPGARGEPSATQKPRAGTRKGKAGG